ncbi:hypothetical protein ACWEWG_35365 [Streptomyces sp. NPDC003758]
MSKSAPAGSRRRRPSEHLIVKLGLQLRRRGQGAWALRPGCVRGVQPERAGGLPGS